MTDKNTKTRKIDRAVEIFKKHLPKRDTMTKREFRALVTAEMKETLELTSAGTIGMYFAWADQLSTGRAAKEYMRKGEPRKKRSEKEAVEAAANEQAAIDAAATAFLSGGNKKTSAPKTEKSTVAPVKKAARKTAATKKPLSKADRLKAIAAAAKNS